MSDQSPRLLVPACLVTGAGLGIAGTFMPSASLRGLLWGIDGIALIVGTVLLALHHFRRDNDGVAAGLLIFALGEALILAGSGMDLATGAPLFGAGAGLWAASLTVISAPKVMPSWVRAVAVVGALLFVVAALQIFMGRPLTALSRPLPFFAYPFLAATLVGWALHHYRDAA